MEGETQRREVQAMGGGSAGVCEVVAEAGMAGRQRHAEEGGAKNAKKARERKKEKAAM